MRTSKNRNSWALALEDQINYTDMKRTSVMVLNTEFVLDDALKRRVDFSQRAVFVACLLSFLSYLFGEMHIMFKYFTILFSFFIGIFTSTFLYRNICIATLKRLLKEPNVIFIAILSILNYIVSFVEPKDQFSFVNSTIYIFVVWFVVSLDTIKLKSRIIILFISILFTLLNIYNIYGYTIGDWSYNVIIFEYTIQGQTYLVYKRSFHQTIYLQILLFTLNGMYVLLHDKKLRKLMFGTENVDRNSNMCFNEFINDADVAAKCRLKYAERIGILSFSIGTLCFILSQLWHEFFIPTLMFVVLGIFSFLAIFYKNISFPIIKRLLKEVNVLVILGYGFINLIVECVSPDRPIFSPLIGITYVIVLLVFVFLDGVKEKSRTFVLLICILLTIINLNNIYTHTLGDKGYGIIFFSYILNGKEYIIFRRYVQLSLFIQITFFSAGSIWTVFQDKQMKKMMFVLDNVYRATGTLEDIEDDGVHSITKEEVEMVVHDIRV